VKYQPDDDWDFHLDMPLKPIDISLALPHYRARNQPVDHRMCMFIGGETAPIRARIVSEYALPSAGYLTEARLSVPL
jgi:hypothetical protein